MEGVRAWMEFFAEMGAGFTIDPGETGRRGPREELETLAAQISDCRACRLHETRRHPVPGEGSDHPDILFVGEGPGETEDQFGRPFIGKAGQLLSRIIEKMGYSREQIFITNVVKCRPPQNREPLADEVAACRPYLMRQIELLEPKVIVCLGRVAVSHLLGSSEGITRLRGKVLRLGEIPVVPTFHPSYILHQRDKQAVSQAKWQVWEDMQVVLKLLGRTV